MELDSASNELETNSMPWAIESIAVEIITIERAIASNELEIELIEVGIGSIDW